METPDSSKGSSIKDVRTRGRGFAKANACVNFACKRPNFADVGGGGKKWQNFADVLYEWPLTYS